jgi:hypothetical protein
LGELHNKRGYGRVLTELFYLEDNRPRGRY